MHLPELAPRDGRVVVFRAVFLQRRYPRSRVRIIKRRYAKTRSTSSWRRLGMHLRAFGIFAGDLLDEIYDPAAQLCVRNAHERLGQRQAVGGRKKFRHIGG